MNTSDKATKIVEALVEVQEEMVAVKDSKNPHFRNGYASLDCILDSIKPSLKEHGLTVLQTTRTQDGVTVCITRIFHKSGEWIESECSIPVEKNTPQGFGSSLTYARRYGIATALGIGTMDDDDANKGEEAAKKKALADHFKRRKAQAKARLEELDYESVKAAFKKSGLPVVDDDNCPLMVGEMVGKVKTEEDLLKIGKLAVQIDKQEKAAEPEPEEEAEENEEPAEKKEPVKKKAPAKKAPAKKKAEPKPEPEPAPEEEEEDSEPAAEAPSDEDPTADDGFIEQKGPNGKLKANKPIDNVPEDDAFCDEVYVKFVVDYFRKNVEDTITEEILAEYIEKDSTEWDYDARTGLIALLQSLMKSETTLHEAFPNHYAK